MTSTPPKWTLFEKPFLKISAFHADFIKILTFRGPKMQISATPSFILLHFLNAENSTEVPWDTWLKVWGSPRDRVGKPKINKGHDKKWLFWPFRVKIFKKIIK